MSINLFLRLRAILPTSPTLIAEVLSHNTDATSTLRLPTGLQQEVYATGVAVGSTFTARGTTVAVGSYAFVRDGVVESQAPSGVVAEVEVGAVVAYPLGPARLTAATAQTLTAGQVGVAYSQSLLAATTGGYAPRTYALASGALPPGLALTTGRLAGTPTAAGVYSFTVTCVDTTRRSVSSAAVGVTITI